MKEASTRANLIYPHLVAAGWNCDKRAGLHPALGDRALSGLWRSGTVLRPERLKSISEGCSPSYCRPMTVLRPERLKSPREGCSPSLYANLFT